MLIVRFYAVHDKMKITIIVRKKMKGSKLFWIWCIGIIFTIIFLPALVTILFIITSNYIHPLFFIGLLLIVAAVIAYYGGQYRNK